MKHNHEAKSPSALIEDKTEVQNGEKTFPRLAKEQSHVQT